MNRKFYLLKSCIIPVVALLISISNYSSIEAKTVRGIVLDNSAEKPIPGSIVMLFVGKTIYAGAITDSTGLFVFDNVTLDRFYIRVKRIGYHEAVTGPLLMSKLDTVKILVKLDVAEIQMNEIVVEEKRTEEWLEKDGFYDRQKNGMGEYLTYRDLKGRHFSNGTALLQTLHQITITPSAKPKNGPGPSVSKIYARRSVAIGMGPPPEVSIYIDDIPFEDASVLDSMSPDDIAAVEFYSGTLTAPAKYSSKVGGVLLIWTKR